MLWTAIHPVRQGHERSPWGGSREEYLGGYDRYEEIDGGWSREEDKGFVWMVQGEILNNRSAGGTNVAVQDLSSTSPMSKSFDKKKTSMTGI